MSFESSPAPPAGCHLSWCVWVRIRLQSGSIILILMVFPKIADATSRNPKSEDVIDVEEVEVKKESKEEPQVSSVSKHYFYLSLLSLNASSFP